MDALTKAGLELYQQLRTLQVRDCPARGAAALRRVRRQIAGRYVPACPRNGGRDDRYLRHGRAQVREVCRPVLCGHRRLPRRPPRRGAEPGCPRSGARTGNARKTAKPGSKASKAAFCLTEERAAAFAYQDALSPAEMKEALAAVAAPDMKAPTIKDMEGWLLGERLIAMEKTSHQRAFITPTPPV